MFPKLTNSFAFPLGENPEGQLSDPCLTRLRTLVLLALGVSCLYVQLSLLQPPLFQATHVPLWNEACLALGPAGAEVRLAPERPLATRSRFASSLSRSRWRLTAENKKLVRFLAGSFIGSMILIHVMLNGLVILDLFGKLGFQEHFHQESGQYPANMIPIGN